MFWSVFDEWAKRWKATVASLNAVINSFNEWATYDCIWWKGALMKRHFNEKALWWKATPPKFCLCWMSFMLNVIYAECHFCLVSFMLNAIYVWCHLCWMSFMLNVIYAECHLCLMPFMFNVIYAECHLCWMSFMLNVIYAECHLCWILFMLNVIYAKCQLCLISIMLSGGLNCYASLSICDILAYFYERRKGFLRGMENCRTSMLDLAGIKMAILFCLHTKIFQATPAPMKSISLQHLLTFR